MKTLYEIQQEQKNEDYENRIAAIKRRFREQFLNDYSVNGDLRYKITVNIKRDFTVYRSMGTIECNGDVLEFKYASGEMSLYLVCRKPGTWKWYSNLTDLKFRKVDMK